ncbi:MAG: helix-turn-helix domain-containing protein [Thermodesulfovibrionales bacterium]|nr:helix-turn-helix domain-containing protein [Thermodesulfovibrionales bacterium]
MSTITVKLDPEDRRAIAEEILKDLRPLIDDAVDVLMTPAEASKFLGVSMNAIYQWVNKAQHGIGDIPHFKVGNRIRFSRKALLKWLEKR